MTRPNGLYDGDPAHGGHLVSTDTTIYASDMPADAYLVAGDITIHLVPAEPSSQPESRSQ